MKRALVRAHRFARRAVGVALALPLAAALVFGPELRAGAGNVTTVGTEKVAPAPMAVDLDILRPDGGPYTIATGSSDCVFVGASRAFELDCDTGKCHWRMASRLPDAGFPQVFPDAGVASPYDTPLPSDTPHLANTPTYRDSVCAEFEATGGLYVSPLLQ